MASNAAPQIDGRCALIAPAPQLGLAAVISSYFREAGEYVPVFEFPEVDIPYSPSAEIGKDGYFGHIVGDRAAVAINNALAAIRPQLIVLLGLTATQQSYLRIRLPPGKLIEINSLADVAARLPMAQSQGDAVACRPSQIVEGLLAAKFGCRPLSIEETAAELPSAHRDHGKGIVLIEDGGGLPELAAINYAFAVHADVVLLPPVDRKELAALPQKLHAWSNDRSHPTLAAFKRKLMRPIWGVPFKDYAFASFFTVGVPYGLFIENVIPCTHVLNNWHCGVFLATVIADEHNPVVFDSALVFSPQQFGSDETDEIAHLLSAGRYTLQSLLGSEATVKNLENYGGFFPYDVLHICSHGGETKGYYAVQEFMDRNGDAHKLEYFEVVGITPAMRDEVTVTSKLIFTTFDGMPWIDQPLKHFPRYVSEDMLSAIHSDRKVKRAPYNYPIALSCHIECHDSIHQGQFHTLAAYGSPLVFNNTCSSSHELAASFVGAGARSYIATLWSVGNTTATAAAITFYKAALAGRTILAAFVSMNKSVGNTKYQSVYILWGLHFSSFRTPDKQTDAKVVDRLIGAYFGYLDKIATTSVEEVRRNCISIAKFPLSEILKRLSREQWERIKGFDPGQLGEHERGLPQLPEEEQLIRGVREIELKD